MILLDKVLKLHGELVVCGVTVREGAPFVGHGRMRGVVMMELMAQTAGVFAGFQARERGEPVRIGFLVGVRDMDIARDWIDVGTQLVVEARRVWGDAALGHFQCTVRDRGEVLARASLSVVRENALEAA